jgi:hypothetical protein
MGKIQIRNMLNVSWRPLLLYGSLIVGLGFLLWWQLAALTGGYSPGEAGSVQAAHSLRYIFEHPINAPYNIVVNGLLHISDHTLALTRVASAAAGAATIIVFYLLVRHWHGERAALIGSILFGTSAWFLHTARLGTPDVLLFGVIGLVAVGVWLKQTANPIALLLAFVLAASLAYVPGMIWVLGLFVLWQWKTIDRVFKKRLWMVSLGALLLLAALVPLGLAIYKDPELAKVMAGLPAAGWPEPLVVLKNLLDVPIQLLLRGPMMPEHWLGRLPILDAFCLAMLALGAYLYSKHLKLPRTHALIAVFFVTMALVALGGSVTITLLVPFVYILVAVGVDFLLDRWYMVFPRNIIAQTVGVSLVSIAIVATAWYGLRHYFVAWPNAPETKQIFTIPEQTATSDTIKQ